MSAGYSTVVGDTVKIRLTIRVDDVLTDPGAVVFTIDRPDGTNSTPSVTTSSAGVYSTKFAVAYAGHYRWRATGTAPASFLREGSFYVASQAAVSF